jgi:hypothetical protein
MVSKVNENQLSTTDRDSLISKRICIFSSNKKEATQYFNKVVNSKNTDLSQILFGLYGV